MGIQRVAAMFKKCLPLALKVAVSGALIWYLIDRNQGRFDEALASVRDIGLEMLALAVLTLLVQIVICGLRWGAVLQALDEPLTLARSSLLYYVGAFFNQALPSSVGGDAVRMYLGRRAGLSLARSINGVMLERAATVVAIVLLVVAVQPVFQTRVDDATGTVMLWSLALLALAAVGGLALLMTLDRLPESMDKWRIVRGLAHLAGDTRRVFLSPGPLVRAVGWGVVGHANVALAVYFLVLGLGIEATLIDCLALVPPVMLATTLPISIAGWGVREAAMAVAFGAIGVAQPHAIALSLLFGVVVVVASLPGGVLWLITREKGAGEPVSPGERQQTL